LVAVLTLGIVSCLLCTCLVGVFDILLVVLLVVGLVVSFFVFGSPPAVYLLIAPGARSSSHFHVLAQKQFFEQSSNQRIHSIQKAKLKQSAIKAIISSHCHQLHTFSSATAPCSPFLWSKLSG
jgi:hypothetical protein